MKKQRPFIIELIARVFKRTKLTTLLLLALLFVSNSFAWFVYSTRVQNSVSAYVKAWNVAFEIGTEPSVNYINIDVSDVYPGMTTYTRNIRAANNGDTPAELSYEIMSATLFGVTYEPDENMTSDELAYKLANDYPFKINITLSTDVIAVGDTNEYYSISVSWPYESGDDLTDTYWGNKSYDYHQANPQASSITMQVKIIATQQEETNQGN